MAILVPEKNQNSCYHYQTQFFAKIYTKVLLFCPGPHWGSPQRSPDLLDGLSGHLLAESGGEDKTEKERLRKVKRGELAPEKWAELDLPTIVGWLRACVKLLFIFILEVINELR